jgi:uncharacterized protein DUF6655
VRHWLFGFCAIVSVVLVVAAGCATIRVTDPPRTATEQFLISAAATKAIGQLSTEILRDRKVFVETRYLSAATQPSDDQAFFIGELRAKLLLNGVRLVEDRAKAQIILEVRSGGLGIDRLEFLLGIPSVYIFGNAPVGSSNVPVATPELSIIKSTRQKGYAQAAFIAYWNDTGEVVSSSGPFVGRTLREDFWFFGTGPRTVGNVPPAEK